MPDLPLTAYDDSIGSNASIDSSAESFEDIDVFNEKMMDADALRYRHPDYEENIAKWEKYTDCYAAREVYKYIHRHTREHQDSYDERVKRGYYLNYSAGVVDLMVAYLYQSAIERSTPAARYSDVFKEFYEDADRRGTKYSVLMQQIATFAQVNGHVGVLVDMPKATGDMTEQDRKESRFRPYLTLVQAQQICDWELDEYGKFEWVKIIVPTVADRSWNQTANDEVETYLIWTKFDWQQWVLDGDEAKLVDSGDHNLGEVPLVIVYNERSLLHGWFGESAIRDIADINIAILNWSSLGDEETYNRCLNILAMEKQDGGPPVEISHHNVLEYASGTKEPSFLTPGDTPLKLIGEQIDRGRDEIYRLAKMGGSTGLLGVREATSGIAYAFEFNETNQSLAKKAESLEQGEISIHRLIYLWLGGESGKEEWTKDFANGITYPREFGVEDFLTELAILTEARTTLTSETAIQEIEKSLANKFFAKRPQDLRDKIVKEIEKGNAAVPQLTTGLLESFKTTMPGMMGSGGQMKQPTPMQGMMDGDKPAQKKQDTTKSDQGSGKDKKKS